MGGADCESGVVWWRKEVEMGLGWQELKDVEMMRGKRWMGD